MLEGAYVHIENADSPLWHSTVGLLLSCEHISVVSALNCSARGPGLKSHIEWYRFFLFAFEVLFVCALFYFDCPAILIKIV